MAASYTWPPGLPQIPQKGYNEELGVLVVRTPMDMGPAKQRRRGQMPDQLNCSFLMTDTQVATLKTFVEDTIRGVARFYFPHPRTQATVETRIVPQGNGTMYNISYVGPGYYNVSLQLEILP